MWKDRLILQNNLNWEIVEQQRIVSTMTQAVLKKYPRPEVLLCPLMQTRCSRVRHLLAEAHHCFDWKGLVERKGLESNDAIGGDLAEKILMLFTFRTTRSSFNVVCFSFSLEHSAV